jgi:hypothetical protein
VEWVTEPYAETGVILRQDLCHVIVSDEVSLMELREHPFSEGFFNRLEVYLQERGKYAIFPVAISEESVQVRVIVQRLTCRLHRKDSTEFAFVYPKDLLEGTPSSTEEDSVKLAVVLKEGSQAFGDSKDRVAMSNDFDYFTVEMLCKLYSALSAA